MVHRMPAQHYHTPSRQNGQGHGAGDPIYQPGAAAYVPSQPLPQQYDGRYELPTVAQPTIKTEYLTADELSNVTRSPNMNVALKCETTGGDEINGVSAAGLGGFHVMRDTSNLPMGTLHFGQHNQSYYMSVSNGIDAHMDELCGASSTPPSTCSSSASVASSKDASTSTYAMPAGSYADLPTTSAVSTAFVADRKRPYPCTLCSSKFGSKMELEEHQNSHTGMKPFQCDVCHSRFNRRSTLWNHKRIHSDAKPFVCAVCQMTFKWKNSLKCHKEMHYRKNETTSIQDNDILTYATAAKKQMKISNPSGGRLGALHFGGARKHQRSASMSLANAATIAVQTSKKLSVPNTVRTATAVESSTVDEFCGTQSVIRHPYSYLTQQQQDHDLYKMQQQQQQQQLKSNNNEVIANKAVIHNNNNSNNNNNNNDNLSDSKSCSDGGGVANFGGTSESTASSTKSSCEEALCSVMPTLSHHYGQQSQQQFFSSLEHCNVNSFEFQQSLGGTLPNYDEAFINGYSALNPALLSVAAAAAVDYSDGGSAVDHFAYGNGGPAVYGGLLHDSSKLFDVMSQPMTVIQDFPPGSATTAEALVHESGYLNYG